MYTIGLFDSGILNECENSCHFTLEPFPWDTQTAFLVPKGEVEDFLMSLDMTTGTVIPCLDMSQTHGCVVGECMDNGLSPQM